MPTLTGEQVQGLDPYAFLAVLGKRVIHPGGRASTDRLLELAAVEAGRAGAGHRVRRRHHRDPAGRRPPGSRRRRRHR